MDKGSIIKQAFLLLGDNNVFNDNKNDKYKVADGLLSSILKTVAVETDFLFNATTTKLTSIGTNELGENRFNVPIDFLNIIKGNEKFRLEGEFLYSKSNELFIQYCREIPLQEYPENMFGVISVILARDMALSFNSYNNRYPLLQQKLEEEKRKIMYEQGYMYEPWGEVE